eukprot:CAMPEP_0173188672 /NCGR_PEP_ID=MMETSP1141-20130122/11376_1 /TAXON_ID=483371 /ORGANISM="non described non described, Strain CCMP2298" /LENGTH=275 /DNA_ID=CAMNT_0014112609 /DNA_START=192 /DNA_END=1019 /DNA_ORIENTATION=-
MMETGRNLKLDVEGGYLSYDVFYPKGASARDPAIVYLPGLVREKNEAKSINLQALCKKSDMTFLSADYYGVGRSSGKFSDGSITRWTQDAINLIDTALKPAAANKVILVGHGLGAWISFLIALQRPDLVSGIVGVSADPDFTEELLWKTLPEDVKTKIMDDGVYEITWGTEKYPITRNLIEDGRKNMLLTGLPGSLPIQCPVRLLHAQEDEEVPSSMAMKLLDNCASQDAYIVLMKNAKHAMDGDRELKALRNLITDVIDSKKSQQFDLRTPGSG